MRASGRFKVAGFAGWLACTLPTLIDMRAGRLSGWSAVVWSVAFLTFGVAYARYLRLGFAQRAPTGTILVGIQAMAGFAMVWAAVGMMKYLCGVTLTIVAGELPYVFSPRVRWIWVAVQSALLTALFWNSFGWLPGLAAGGAYAAFHVFAVGQALLELELTSANAKLQATGELLAEHSRIAERLRISRDLHDSLGHHLSALSIQLDVASRRIEGAAAEPVLEAHAITRLLLSDLRNVVSQLRETGRVDLAEAIRPFAATGDGPQVEFDMPTTLFLDDSAQAHALLRCIQEILTNARRHGGARRVWIRLAPDANGVYLHARDDGSGVAVLTLGNGLRGMRERFEEHAGYIEFTSAPGQGFEVRAFMPRPALTS